MITNKSDARELLSEKGIRPTYQRLKILEYLMGSGRHPTVDMIYRDLVREMPTISKTTVYNTLKSFIDAGIAVGIAIAGTEMRFDFNSCGHHHFLCEKCGRIIDLEIVCPNFSRGEIGGHRIRELHGYFKGICAACCRKAGQADTAARGGRTS